MTANTSSPPCRRAARATALVALVLGLAVAGCGEPPPPEWTREGAHRWLPLNVEETDAPGFTRLDPSGTGLEAANFVSDSLAGENRILADGSGVAIGDVDGDGRPDVYLTRVARPNVLYRNLGGWEFDDVTEGSGVAVEGRPSKGATLVDVDGDGDLDLLVTVLGERNRLYRNDGTGRFEDVTDASGLDGALGSTTATLADVDGDGDLDLYVASYKTKTAEDLFSADEISFDSVVIEDEDGYRVAPRFREHYRVFDDHGAVKRWEYGEPDAFYLNDGSGRFERVPFTEGRFLDEDGRPLEETPRDWGLTARFYDVDGDGAPDLYVCNDFESPDHVWMNDGSGTFRAIDRLAIRTTSMSCMGVDFSDVDRDGRVDVFTTDMLARDARRRVAQVTSTVPLETRPGDIRNRPQVDRNTLQMARGDGTFAEMARQADAAASGWSWGTLFLDVDLDGYEDLLIANGHRWDLLDAETQLRLASDRRLTTRGRSLEAFPELPLENLALRNRGDGAFAEPEDDWGFGPEADISHGMAAGDLDGDGDLDVVATRLDRAPAVYRNDTDAPRVAVRLDGPAGNTDGVGAVVELEGPGVPEQRKEITVGGMYLSSSQTQVAFAAPADDAATLRVRWTDGATTLLDDVTADRLYEIRHPDGPAVDGPGRGGGDREAASAESGRPASGAPHFEDRSDALDHEHAEAYFDDFRRQPLLPSSLAQLGPGVAWHDADRDGDPDLFVGSGRGGELAYFRNDGGRLRRVPLDIPESSYDQTGLVGLAGDGPELLVGQSAYEAATPEEASGTPSALGLRLEAGGALEPLLPPTRSATGPLALADLDGDRDLDLFVGGRVYPTAYPVSTSSRVYENRGGRFVLDSARTAALAEVGMVSAATFSDLDLDGRSELVLALDWGPVRVFENVDGRLRDVSASYPFGQLAGRWNGVATGDLNEDGRPDVIVTGWGENLLERPSRERPLFLYYGDLDNDGTLDMIEARHSESVGDVAPLRRLVDLGREIPALRSNIPSIREASGWSLERLLGNRMSAARRVHADRFAHTVFLSDDEGWTSVPLPAEAQRAPAFHVGVADFDGDGHDDLFLSQNFYPTRDGMGRFDAGRGLWLRGDGSGSLEPVPGDVSGVRVYGDARGAALADYDGDGRVDLVVTQNGGRTRLFRNRGADPGLRVRLEGPPDNPDAVGARLRVLYEGGAGPAREIQAGSGYWSQDAATQVFGLARRPRAVEVTWPDGATREVAVEEDQRSVTVRWETRER